MTYVLVIIFSLAVQLASASERTEATAPAPRPTATIPRVSAAPRLDDYLGDGPRPRALAVTDFLQRYPGNGTPASEDTRAYLSYDASHLFVVFECAADPSRLRAHLSRRDDLTGDDVVGLQLDTFGDNQRAYMFMVNPLGVQRDGIYTEGQHDDFAFDTVWHSEGRVTARGYVVLLAIPFRSLRFSRADDAHWRVALTRHISVRAETATWPRLTDRVEAWVSQFAELRGLHDVSGSDTGLSLNPYQSMSTEHVALDGAAPARPRLDARTGLDAKMVFRDSAALDVAVNPDFSQVESDEPQPLLNQRYEVYFPEKRPFFNDGAGLFATPEVLLFTRRIANPLLGTRLTAKVGPWVLGGLAAVDRPRAGLADAGDTTTPHASDLVGRVMYERRAVRIGGLWTSMSGPLRTNQVASADLRWAIAPRWSIDAQAIVSADTTTRTERGRAIYAALHHTSRHLVMDMVYRDRSPTFHANALGFFRRTDIREVASFTRYSWRPTRGPVVSVGPSIDTEVNWDSRGTLQDWFVDAPWRVNTVGPASISVGRREFLERYRDVPLRYHESTMAGTLALGRTLQASASLARGTRPSYLSSPGTLPQVWPSSTARVEVTIRPATRWQIAETLLSTALRGRGEALARTVFTERTARTKVSVQLTRSFSVRVIGDWNQIRADQSVVRLWPSRRWTMDALGAYLLYPGTAVYVGYSERGSADAEDAEALGRRTSAASTTPRGRLVFVKVGVLLRP